MSTGQDPTELSPPRDPASYGRGSFSGPGVWGWVAFGVVCVLLGYGMSRLGPRLLPTPPQAPAGVEAPALADPAGVARAATAAPPLPVAPPAPTSEAVLRLTERVEALEADQTRLAQAASSALASASLMEVAQTSRPFADELAVLAAVSPPSTDLRALRRVAEKGAPSRIALAASFPDYAARAAGAAREPGTEAGLTARLGSIFSRVFTLRQVGDVPGKGVDALLARAERQVSEGDLDRALKTLDALPPGGRDAMAAWRAAAESRAEIDRRVSAVRLQALEDLARQARGGL